MGWAASGAVGDGCGALATKADVAALKTDLAKLKTELKTDIARLDVKIESVKADLLKWMFGALVAQGGLIVALIKLL